MFLPQAAKFYYWVREAVATETKLENEWPKWPKGARSAWMKRSTSQVVLFWGCSSVGRALEWHSRGQGFDSPQLHQLMKKRCFRHLFSLTDIGTWEANPWEKGFDYQRKAGERTPVGIADERLCEWGCKTEAHSPQLHQLTKKECLKHSFFVNC